MERLKRLAADAPNISFTGWLSDPDLQQLVGRARAAVYVPINEDFGMAPVEAMAAGKPVIGVAEGGMLETVVHGETGLLIDGPLSPDSICEAVQRLEQWGTGAMRLACERRAALFSEEAFVKQMHNVVLASPKASVAGRHRA
jgi:glycosyltransferase involved in cell wall biosynthesis